MKSKLKLQTLAKMHIFSIYTKLDFWSRAVLGGCGLDIIHNHSWYVIYRSYVSCVMLNIKKHLCIWWFLFLLIYPFLCLFSYSGQSQNKPLAFGFQTLSPCQRMVIHLYTLLVYFQMLVMYASCLTFWNVEQAVLVICLSILGCYLQHIHNM